MSVNIGDLRGTISLEDQFSNTMTLVARRVQQSVGQLTGIFSTVALGATVAATAVTGIASAIIGLGIKGSHLNDVEDSFKRLAGGAENATAIFKAMNDGVAGTVDSLVLMEMANRALSTGAIKTAADFGTVTAAARVLSREGFGSVESVLNTVNSAMTTGRVRSLQYLTGVIDLKSAEEQYAKSLGTTRDALSAQGKLHAAQIAIIEALNRKVAEAGNLQKSFAERVTSARLVISNWFDDLAKAVAKSPQVNKALDDIGAALVKNFGGAGQTALELIVGWINKFAEAAGHYGPIIIGWIAKIVDGIKAIWRNVTEAWDLVPDWFKNIAKDAALAGGAIYLTHQTLSKFSGAGGFGLADMATTVSGTRDAFLSLALAIPIIKSVGSAIQGLSVAEVVLISTRALGASLLALATGPVGLAILLTGIGLASWEAGKSFRALYDRWQEGRSMWAFFGKGGEFWDNSIIGRMSGMSKEVDVLADSFAHLNAVAKDIQLPNEQWEKNRLAQQPPTGGGGESDVESRAKEIETATQSSIEKTARLWDQYFDTIDKAATESLDIQLRALDRWYAAELSTLDKTKKDNVNYWNEHAVLGDLFYAKVMLAEHEWTEKVVTESRARMAAFEAEAQKAVTAIAKGLSGQPDILKDMSAATATFTDELNTAADATHDLIAGSLLTSRAIEDVSMQGKLMATSYSVAEKAISDAMAAGVRGALPLTEKQKELIARMKELGFSAEEMAAKLQLSLQQVHNELGTVKFDLSDLAEAFSQLAQISGGSFGGVTQAIGTAIGAINVLQTSVKALNNAVETGGKVSWELYAAAAMSAASVVTLGLNIMFDWINKKNAETMAKFHEWSALSRSTGERLAAIQVDVPPVPAGTPKAIWEGSLTQIRILEAAHKKLWDAYATGSIDAIRAAAKEFDALLTRYETIAAKARSQFGPSRADLAQAAVDAKDVLDYMTASSLDANGQILATAQFTQDQLNKAYYAWQKSMADTGDAAADAWVKAHAAVTGGATAANKAISDLQKERDDLAKSIEDEAWEPDMGIMERDIRAQMAKLDAEIAATAQGATSAAEAAATETASIVGAATNDTAAAIDTMVTDTADKTGKAMSGAAVVVSDAFKVAAEQIAVDIGEDTPAMMEVTANGIKLVMADAAFIVAEEFKGAGQAARRSFDKVEIRAGELAQEIEAILGGLGYEIPVTFRVDTSGLDGLGASIPMSVPVPIPMAAGGSGHAYGPMLFSTRGDEDWAFSGEGQRFGQAPQKGSSAAPTVTELHTHNHIDGREILPVFITAIQRDDRGVTTIIKRKVRGR